MVQTCALAHGMERSKYAGERNPAELILRPEKLEAPGEARRALPASVLYKRLFNGIINRQIFCGKQEPGSRLFALKKIDERMWKRSGGRS